MKIEIWSDFACPFCYIGKRRLETALEQFAHKDSLEIIYKSFELDPQAPVEVNHDVHDMLSAKYGMSREKAIEMNRSVSSQAKEVGLDFQPDAIKLTNTFDAHRVAQYAATQGKASEMTEELFRAYFTDSRHLGDHETLANLAVEAGLGRTEVLELLAGTNYAAEVRADEAEARQLGVTGVPFFVIDRKYAISGAQPSSAFLQAIQTAWDEAKPLKVLNPDGNNGAADGCSGGSCSV